MCVRSHPDTRPCSLWVLPLYTPLLVVFLHMRHFLLILLTPFPLAFTFDDVPPDSILNFIPSLNLFYSSYDYLYMSLPCAIIFNATLFPFVSSLIGSVNLVSVEYTWFKKKENKTSSSFGFELFKQGSYSIIIIVNYTNHCLTFHTKNHIFSCTGPLVFLFLPCWSRIFPYCRLHTPFSKLMAWSILITWESSQS